MSITASKLRENVYQILDEVLLTGQAIEINRKGSLLKIVPVQTGSKKLKELKKRKFSDEDSENFTHIDWSGEWKKGK